MSRAASLLVRATALAVFAGCQASDGNLSADVFGTHAFVREFGACATRQSLGCDLSYDAAGERIVCTVRCTPETTNAQLDDVEAHAREQLGQYCVARAISAPLLEFDVVPPMPEPGSENDGSSTRHRTALLVDRDKSSDVEALRRAVHASTYARRDDARFAPYRRLFVNAIRRNGEVDASAIRECRWMNVHRCFVDVSINIAQIDEYEVRFDRMHLEIERLGVLMLCPRATLE